MTDDELTDAWEGTLGRAVTHDEHLRIAFTLHRRHGAAEARRRLLDGTFANCRALGAAERFDPDLTERWSDLIARLLEPDDDSYEALVERHPELGASDLLGLPAWKRAGG